MRPRRERPRADQVLVIVNGKRRNRARGSTDWLESARARVSTKRVLCRKRARGDARPRREAVRFRCNRRLINIVLKGGAAVR